MKFGVQLTQLKSVNASMMTSSNENIFRVTGHFCGEFTGPRWILRTKASDAELWCFLLIWTWINSWVNNPEAGDLRRHRAHCDVSVMSIFPIYALLSTVPSHHFELSLSSLLSLLSSSSYYHWSSYINLYIQVSLSHFDTSGTILATEVPYPTLSLTWLRCWHKTAK